MRSLCEIREERTARSAVAAQRESKNQRQQQHADGVIPVEQFEPPALAGKFLRVGPGTPAKHGDHAEDHRPSVILQNKHCGSSIFVYVLPSRKKVTAWRRGGSTHLPIPTASEKISGYRRAGVKDLRRNFHATALLVPPK